MAQQQYRKRKKQSDFPIFEYIDMVMPDKLIARFKAMPRHVRWTIISGVASLVLLWIVLDVVVGGLNYWVNNRGPSLYNAYYLPYDLASRSLPAIPENLASSDSFRLLPDQIAGQYTLQIPPTEEEQLAAQQAELEAFVALSLPAQDALVSLQETLQPADAVADPAASEATAVVPEAAAADTTAADATAADAAASDATAADAAASEAAAAAPAADSAAVPTLDPVQLQLMALDGVLMPLETLNDNLKEADSLDPVRAQIPDLQSKLSLLAGSGLTLPPEVTAFQQHLDSLPAVKAPVYYNSNECLMAALTPAKDSETVPPCDITQRATYVEQGSYLNQKGAEFNVVIAEFPRSVDADWAVKQLFYRARGIGQTGNFALDNIIEYNYFFAQIDSIYTLGWSHDNWVYSVSAATIDDIDSMMTAFPY